MPVVIDFLLQKAGGAAGVTLSTVGTVPLPLGVMPDGDYPAALEQQPDGSYVLTLIVPRPQPGGSAPETV